MNYLAHLQLGGSSPAQLLGSLYGDFVKGPLRGQWPADVEAAIRLHRRIDTYTDAHPLLAAARGRFSADQRRYAGIVLDVFFDHCLARHWHDYVDEPLPQFTARVYQLLQREAQLPERLANIAPIMAAQDWLGSYENFAVIERVIQGIDRRLSKPGLLLGAVPELERLYEPLSSDFREFYPQLQVFAGEQRRLILMPLSE